MKQKDYKALYLKAVVRHFIEETLWTSEMEVYRGKIIAPYNERKFIDFRVGLEQEGFYEKTVVAELMSQLGLEDTYVEPIEEEK